MEDEELAVESVESKLGVIEPALLVKLVRKRAELRSQPKRRGGGGRR